MRRERKKKPPREAHLFAEAHSSVALVVPCNVERRTAVFGAAQKLAVDPLGEFGREAQHELVLHQPVDRVGLADHAARKASAARAIFGLSVSRKIFGGFESFPFRQGSFQCCERDFVWH